MFEEGILRVCMYSFIQKIILTINQGRRKALVALGDWKK
jgi:hypothetical protein